MDARIDWDREARTGFPEAVLCSHKSPAQIAGIIAAARAQISRLLLTRLDNQMFMALPQDVQQNLDYDIASRTAIFGVSVPCEDTGVGIVAAGTSDMPIALEACRTLGFAGHAARVIADVGVAGLWRLIERRDELSRCRVVIAVAGMEGALFSVVGGLVEAPVIAVPTSVGYGVAAGGTVALNAALASCAPGVTVVNIDNGFGAAAAAIKMLRLGRNA